MTTENELINGGEEPAQLYTDIIIPIAVLLTLFVLNAVAFLFIWRKRKLVLQRIQEEYEELPASTSTANKATVVSVDALNLAPLQSIELEQL